MIIRQDPYAFYRLNSDVSMELHPCADGLKIVLYGEMKGQSTFLLAAREASELCEFLREHF